MLYLEYEDYQTFFGTKLNLCLYDYLMFWMSLPDDSICPGSIDERNEDYSTKIESYPSSDVVSVDPFKKQNNFKPKIEEIERYIIQNHYQTESKDPNLTKNQDDNQSDNIGPKDISKKTIKCGAKNNTKVSSK